MPQVSVIIPAYNHEKFVEECLQSVLNQTFQDFEIIITDDASTDRTVEIIEQFTDPRIKLFKHSTNRGVSIAANNCILHANGKYIAWLSTDDAWYPEKLELQVRYLDNHPEIGAVFGKVDWIDEAGNLITANNFPYLNLFDVPNRTRVEWLRQFFLAGNCLSLPSSLVRSECFAKVGLFNPVYAKLLDLDLWIRISFEYDIVILDQKLIRNRWLGDESNASGNTINNRVQVGLEHRYSLNHYLKITDPHELLAVFPDSTNYGEVAANVIPYFLGRIAIDSNWDYKTLWGLDAINELLKNMDAAQTLERKCGFTYVDFFKLSVECDPFKLQRIQQLTEIEEERKRTITGLITQLDNNQQMIDTLAIQIANHQQMINTLETQIASYQQTIDNSQREAQFLAAQLHETQKEVDTIKNSRSWRYTQFLRQLWGKLQ